MRPDTPPTIRLADYTPPPFLVETVHLTLRLDPDATRVRARLRMIPNAEAVDLELDAEDMTVLSAVIDGRPVDPTMMRHEGGKLRIDWDQVPERAFDLETEVEIAPKANTALEGLYMSKGMYCTQCEAEGFRKITPFPDRPDVMATYTVRIEADPATHPVLLSNGNLTASGPGWAEWHDPWPKPCYLFALVAGDLRSHDDRFTTASGRAVALRIYVRPGDEARCAYAMDALKRSMAWDEREYGREYDLDLFMIVAVDDFNAGAMENKGLNIFNAKYVLASPETATDRDYALIEAIIAHEYFHNWTGNRITCRDWFQLCLKEGLTVFRDQQFSGDERSHAVKRIDDVQALRARQFREDAGPLAHPVRPEAYQEINNFYTATVYEKGAEVIGMLRTLVGAQAYRKALDLYFERHDGQACTIEDWLTVFEDATARDLSQFKRWYSQAGTPRITVAEDYADGTYTLTLTQTTAPTPGQAEKAPQVIPIAVGLLNDEGQEVVPTQVLALSDARQSFRFEGLNRKPVPSLLRGFSAPVILDHDPGDDARRLLLAHDTDPFNKWEAGQALTRDQILRLATGADADAEPRLLSALLAVLDDPALDPAFKAKALSFPSLEEVFRHMRDQGMAADPLDIRGAIIALDRALAGTIPDLGQRIAALRPDGPYTPAAADAGRRALAGRLLGLRSRLDPAAAQAAFDAADNMTEAMQALALLVREGRAAAALAAFYDRWQADPLVLDKWFSVQAMGTPPDRAAETVEALTDHAEFDLKNPNRFRSVVGAFAMGNMAGFHRADGAGYRLLADWLIRLDPLNPQTTARLMTAFETWRDFDEARQALILTQLQRIADTPNLSRDSTEIVTRILDAPGA